MHCRTAPPSPPPHLGGEFSVRAWRGCVAAEGPAAGRTRRGWRRARSSPSTAASAVINSPATGPVSMGRCRMLGRLAHSCAVTGQGEEWADRARLCTNGARLKSAHSYTCTIDNIYLWGKLSFVQRACTFDAGLTARHSCTPPGRFVVFTKSPVHSVRRAGEE